jgi:hypothetical protein
MSSKKLMQEEPDRTGIPATTKRMNDKFQELCPHGPINFRMRLFPPPFFFQA